MEDGGTSEPLLEELEQQTDEQWTGVTQKKQIIFFLFTFLT